MRHRLRQGAQILKVHDGQTLSSELANGQARSGECQWWNDDVQARTVFQAGIDHGRRLVDASTRWRQQSLDHTFQRGSAFKASCVPCQSASPFNEDVDRPIDHDLADLVVRQQVRTVPDEPDRGDGVVTVAVPPFQPAKTAQTEGPPLLLINVYSARKKHEDNLLNCGIFDAELAKAEAEYESLEKRGLQFDDELMNKMEKAGGPDYRYLTSLAFRQTIAAHKLVADVDGQPMLFSKENDSNGCIDTVDVTYPSSPFFLYFNPKLLEAQLEPVM